MQATLGFLQHYAPDAASLRALLATLAAQAHAQLLGRLRALGHALTPQARDEFGALDAHMRRDVGLGEFGSADPRTLHADALRA